MRVAILSRGPKLYSTQRIVEETKAAGMTPIILDPLEFSVTIGGDQFEILHRGKVTDVDVVLPRIGHSITRHGVNVLRQFEEMDVPVANSSRSILRSRDKLYATQLLAKNRVPMPVTAWVRQRADIDRAIATVGGLPLVVKASEGTHGRGVFLCDTSESVHQTIEALLLAGDTVLLQQFVPESKGIDMRVFVVGDEVVASMRREAQGDEFRSNFHLGGQVIKADLPPQYEKVARRAARLLGLNIAGVDLLVGKDGPLLLEVNSSPGLEGIEAASGVNVAAKVVEYLAEIAEQPEVRVEELLRQKPGHGVLSFDVSKHPWHVGTTLKALFADEKQTPVFALDRAGDHIWRPRSSIKLQKGDRLVLYGALRPLRKVLKDLRQKPA